jgi:hypothetical protein
MPVSKVGEAWLASTARVPKLALCPALLLTAGSHVAGSPAAWCVKFLDALESA